MKKICRRPKGRDATRKTVLRVKRTEKDVVAADGRKGRHNLEKKNIEP